MYARNRQMQAAAPTAAAPPPSPPDWDAVARRIQRKSIVLGAYLAAMVLLACVLHDHLSWLHCGSPEEPTSMEDDIHSHVPEWMPPRVHNLRRGSNGDISHSTTRGTGSGRRGG